MARRATKIHELRSAAKGPVLLLDAGYTLFGQRLASDTEGRVIIAAMNAMQYDAMTVGGQDLDHGSDVLLARVKEAKFKVVSCNLLWRGTSKTLLEPYTIIKRDGVRFGIIGVSEPDILNSPGAQKVYQVADAAESVLKYMPEVRSKSDVVIVLSHLGLEGHQALAQAVPDIDIIVGGSGGQLLNQPLIVGKTLIIQAGYDGEWLGRLDVSFDAQGKASDPKAELIVLGPEVADNPELAALVARYEQEHPEPTPLSN